MALRPASCSPRSRRMILRPKSSTSSARWRRVWLFKRLELLMPSLQYPANGRFGGQQRSSQFTFELARRKQLPQHLAMRAKDAGQRGIEFGLDALRVLIEFRQGFLNAVRETNQLAVNVVLANRRRRASSTSARRRRPRPAPCPNPARCSALRASASDCVTARYRRRHRFHGVLPSLQRLIDSSRCAQVTANEPSPTAKPTRLVDPERISPAASMPGTVVSSGQGSRSPRGHNPERTTSVPVNR